MSDDDPRFSSFAKGIYNNLKELIPEEILGELPEADEVPVAPLKFKLPELKPNIVFPVLAIAGAIFGIVAFFAATKFGSKKETKPTIKKPKTKTKTVTITKVREPTQEEMLKFSRTLKKPTTPEVPPTTESTEEINE